jgi:predicted Rossmann-fold nucleotide-binding protein
MRGGRTRVSQYVAIAGLSGLNRNQNLLAGGAESIITVSGVVYKVHTFTATGSLTVAPYASIGSVEYLVVAGGGGGGNMTAVAAAVRAEC